MEKGFIAWLASLFLFSFLHAQGAHAQEKIAYVFEIKGEWALKGESEKLTKGTALPAGGVIEFRNASFGENYIFIADRRGKVILSSTCFDPEDCKKPIVLPKSSPSDSSLLSRLFGAVMSFMRGEPDKYAAPINRTHGRLEDAVVLLSDGRADLSRSFKNKEKAKYQLRFNPKGVGGLTGVEQVDFDWDPKKPAPLLVPGIKAGLYEIQLLSRGYNQPLEPGEEAWVLLTPPGQYYEDISAQFAQLLAETAQWSEKGLEEARRSFLRAYLGYLDAQRSK